MQESYLYRKIYVEKQGIEPEIFFAEPAAVENGRQHEEKHSASYERKHCNEHGLWQRDTIYYAAEIE